jgi:hypothetical protein
MPMPMTAKGMQIPIPTFAAVLPLPLPPLLEATVVDDDGEDIKLLAGADIGVAVVLDLV